MIIISTDSTADLEHLIKENNIPVMPLAVMLEGNEYYDGVNIDAQKIFESYEASHSLPKTAARAVSDYEEFFTNLTKDGNEVVHISISSDLSVSYNNAVAAANNVSNVHVVDSRSLSTGIGLLVLKAIDLRNEGFSAQEIFDKITALVPCVHASFVVDTMEYLHKGGRCSGVAAFFAKRFRIHPQIIVKDGKMVVGQKFTGKMRSCLERYVIATLKAYNKPDTTRIFITHSYADEEDVEYVKNLIRGFCPDFKEIIETHASSTITSHCGKGTLGILYINEA